MIEKTEKDITQNWKPSECPVVSICCITYNHEHYIAETMDGFLAQNTDFRFEIIVGDDHSTDNTSLILSDYAVRFPNIVKLFTRSENIGMMRNFKNAFEACSGKYIALCEGDDIWTSPVKLQKQIDFLEKHPDYAISCHNCEILDNDSNAILGSYPNLLEDKEMSLNNLLNANIAHTCSFVYRNIGIKIPPFFEKLTLGDWPLHMLHAQYGKIKFFPENMAQYRVHAGGMWSSTDRIKQLDASILALKYMNKYFKNNYSLQINKTISNFFLAKAHYYLDTHRIFLASRCYIYANKYSKISYRTKTNYILKRYFPKIHPYIILIYTKTTWLWKKQ